MDAPVLVDSVEHIVANAPCAMVPLKPKELNLETLSSSTEVVTRDTTSTGIWNGFDVTIDDRCTFSLSMRVLGL